MEDASISLPDGRVLAYTDLGSSEGPVVFYFHGAPTSRLDLSAYSEQLAALHVRVVSPDRPNYGRSSPQSGRELVDWPSDVAALADRLGIERFAVTGISSGGPYVAVCAALLADRVTSGAIVAGVTDFGWPGAWEGYAEWEATVMRLGDEAAATTWCEEQFGADGSRFFQAIADDPMAPADEAFLGDEAVMGWLSGTIAEAFRQGVGGYAQDATVQGRPWSFDLRAIRAPVLVVHGEADVLVPAAHARHTADVIPGAKLRILPEHGHISLFNELPPICGELTASR